MKKLILICLLLAACKQEKKTNQEIVIKTANAILQTDQQKQAAAQLIAARNTNELIALPEKLQPKSLKEGYAIQDIIIETITTPQVGWKVAITNKPLMNKAGVKEPVSGPLFKKWTHEAPFEELHGFPTLYGFEFEFAFKMKTDLPHKKEPYTIEEVKNAVESMHIAIEPVGTRYDASSMQVGVNLFAADHGGNFSFIHSPAIANWEQIDLANVEVVAYFNAKEVGREKGANVLGNPLNSLTWLANHLPKRGHLIKKDDWITTGAVIGPLPIKPPVKVKGDFGALGVIEFNFKN